MTLAPALYANIESYGHEQALEDQLEDIRAAIIDNSFMDQEEAQEIIKYLDPREEDQAEDLQARREAWKASQGGEAE